MSDKKLCDFGKEIEKRLVDINKKQVWLIEAVANDTGKYFDRSYLNKIETGKIATPSMVNSICKILEIDAPIT